MPRARKAIRDEKGNWVPAPKDEARQARMAQTEQGGWTAEVDNYRGMTRGEYNRLVAEYLVLDKAWKIAVRRHQHAAATAIEGQISKVEQLLADPNMHVQEVSIEELNKAGDWWQPGVDIYGEDE
jgi:hypothetical protein